VDGVPLSGIDLDDLGLTSGDPVAIRVGVRADADHVGGINLFGRAFGNYPQDLELRIEYEMDRRAVAEGGGVGDGRLRPALAVAETGGAR
jgi:hypothetical protein